MRTIYTIFALKYFTYQQYIYILRTLLAESGI